jgi:hypothetical protein
MPGTRIHGLQVDQVDQYPAAVRGRRVDLDPAAKWI